MKLDKWIESVPNFSEGRDLKKVERICVILSSYLWSVAQSYVPHSSQSYVQVMVEDSAVDQRRQQTVRTRLARLQEACVVERGRSDAGVAELFDITKEREVKGVEKGAAYLRTLLFQRMRVDSSRLLVESVSDSVNGAVGHFEIL